MNALMEREFQRHGGDVPVQRKEKLIDEVHQLPTGKRKLVDCLKIQVKPIHLERLAIIDNEDFSDYIRKAAEDIELISGICPSQKHLDEGEFALKQFYSLSVLDPLNSHAVVAKLDPFWHSHILHTMDYMDFWMRVTGKIVHHFPLDKGNHLEVAGVKDEMRATLERLHKIYGENISAMWVDAMNDTDISSALICWNRSICKSPSILMEFALFPHDPLSLEPDFHKKCKERLIATKA